MTLSFIIYLILKEENLRKKENYLRGTLTLIFSTYIFKLDTAKSVLHFSVSTNTNFLEVFTISLRVLG